MVDRGPLISVPGGSSSVIQTRGIPISPVPPVDATLTRSPHARLQSESRRETGKSACVIIEHDMLNVGRRYAILFGLDLPWGVGYERRDLPRLEHCVSAPTRSRRGCCPPWWWVGDRVPQALEVPNCLLSADMLCHVVPPFCVRGVVPHGSQRAMPSKTSLTRLSVNGKDRGG